MLMKKVIFICLIAFSLSIVVKAQSTNAEVKYDYLLLTLDEIGNDNSLTIIKSDGTKEETELSKLSGTKPQTNFESNNNTLVNTLKKLGDQGWELVSISDVTVERTSYQFSRYVFKKAKQ